MTDAALRVAQANNQFAFDLYAKVRTESGNLFFSPYSVVSAAAMVYAGARGDTEAQMAEVFHFDMESHELHSGFYDFDAALSAAAEQRDYELNVANGLWAQQGHPFLGDYLDLLESYYGADVSQVDFGSAEAADQINEWVRTATADTITEILQAGDVDALTRLMVTNAIYFKGAWVNAFDPESTHQAPFTTADGGTVEVEMMEVESNFNTMWTEEFELLEMPYLGGDLAMIVLLPHEGVDLGQVEAALSADNLENWMGQLSEFGEVVRFPKFTFETRLELAPTLIEMGMRDAFDATADFSGMDGSHDLFVSGAFQSAWIDVNEQGTEAAAATTFTIACSANMPFEANRPFIFLIRESRSGAVLFLGRVENPGG